MATGLQRADQGASACCRPARRQRALVIRPPDAASSLVYICANFTLGGPVGSQHRPRQTLDG